MRASYAWHILEGTTGAVTAGVVTTDEQNRLAWQGQGVLRMKYRLLHDRLVLGMLGLIALLSLVDLLLFLLPTHPGTASTSQPLPQRAITHLPFLKSIKENASFNQVTFPLLEGRSHSQTVWYVVTDSSDEQDARTRGVLFTPKLANAKGTAAVQRVQIKNGIVDFPATVDFSPQRVIEPGTAGFPPAKASPPAVGESGYSPFIELPNGIVLNAPHLANDSGAADKVLSLDTQGRQVTYRETTGLFKDTVVHYVSFDASSPVAAAIEDVTYAPALNAAPVPDSEDPKISAREKLIAFVNGQVGAANAQRQGLNSALLDGLDPLNILNSVPSDTVAYSPLWDIHLAAWTPTAISDHQQQRQRDFSRVLTLVRQGLVTGPDGGAFGASGFVVNCPVMSQDLPQ